MFSFFRDRHPPAEAGRAAEDLARQHLETRGYIFRAANHRTRFGEVDLIMEQDETVVFVEVRARRSPSFGHPLATVDHKKQTRIARAALDYIKTAGLARRPLRFDVVAFSPEGLLHIPNAFVPPRHFTI